jgi:hypothetical protein
MLDPNCQSQCAVLGQGQGQGQGDYIILYHLISSHRMLHHIIIVILVM